MSQPSYPELSDLSAALENAGLSAVVPSSEAQSRALSAAIAQLQRDSDWSPFLAAQEEATRKFTVKGEQKLFLGASLVEEPSLVMFHGNELTLGVNYFLEPANAVEEGKPYTRINFCFRRTSAPGGVEITGRWGFCTELPDDVWSGVLALAAWNLRGELQRRFTDSKVAESAAGQGAIKAKESGPLRVEYTTIEGAKAVDLFATFDAWRWAYECCLEGRVMRQP